jgi:hypothetical protein
MEDVDTNDAAAERSLDRGERSCGGDVYNSGGVHCATDIIICDTPSGLIMERSDGWVGLV